MNRRKKTWLNNVIRRYFLMLLICCDNLFLGKVQAVRCFSCSVKPPSSRANESTKLCSKFDASPDFEVDCPLSTLCQTRSFQLQTHTELVAVTTRGCAQQDYSYQMYEKDAGWKTVTKIEDKVYDEGCFISVDSSLRRHSTEYCYCSKDLCNRGNSVRSYFATYFLAVFLLK